MLLEYGLVCFSGSLVFACVPTGITSKGIRTGEFVEQLPVLLFLEIPARPLCCSCLRIPYHFQEEKDAIRSLDLLYRRIEVCTLVIFFLCIALNGSQTIFSV